MTWCLVESPDATEILRQHADAIGAVRRRGRQSKVEQQGQRQERSTAGDDIQRPGDESHHQTEPQRGSRHPAEIIWSRAFARLQREIGRVQRADTRVQLGQVLPMLQIFQQVAASALLAMRQVLEQFVLFE